MNLKVEQPLASYNGTPQKEDGYTPIANELLEAILLSDFSKRQLLVIMTIARMTYGYSKKSDALSTVQIANMTGINRPKVSEAIKELIEMNVLQKIDSGRMAHGVFVNEILINKHYKQWGITDTKLVLVNGYQNDTGTKTVTDTKTVPQTGTKMGTQRIPKRDTHKTIKTSKTNIADFDAFWSAYPSKVDKKKSLIAWNKYTPDIGEVLTALEWQVKTKKWIDGFYPNPTTYLNGERWKDEPQKGLVKQADVFNGMKII